MKSSLVNEWIDDKIHPITGFRHHNGNTELAYPHANKKYGQVVNYDYILPNNLPDNY